MSAERKSSTVFFWAWSEDFFESMSDEEVGVLTRAVIEYDRNNCTDEPSELLRDYYSLKPFSNPPDRMIIAAFKRICGDVQRNRKKYEERCEKNAEIAKERWHKANGTN